MAAGAVSPRDLWQWLHDGDEIVVADVRDGGPFARDHILVASNVSLAQIEFLVPALVPRRDTRMVLVDDDGGNMAARASQVLEQNGYSNLHVLEGGNRAWVEAGYQLFSGSGIISKAFGELVEETLDTPRISAQDLRQWQEENREFISVDSRPLAEYRTISLPGASDCPGAELVLRVPAMLNSSDTPIVVNCAGRTRSIIGAQSLRNAGIKNPVYALKNGTMGWQLEHFPAVQGADNMVPEPDSSGLALARSHAEEVRRTHNIRLITTRDLARFQSDMERTTYVFDVRLGDSFERGHVPGALHAPGGQLVQATDSFAAVRNARIVLTDEHLVQSIMTAHWLQQMGWDVYVLGDARDILTEVGPAQLRPLSAGLVSVSPVELVDIVTDIDGGQITLIDVGESYWYREGRIPGSYFAMRSRLNEALTRFDKQCAIVFCCGDGRTSPLAASDAVQMGFSNVRWLAGGRNSWKRHGRTFERIGEETDSLVLTDTDDMWYPPWARKEGVDEAIMQYLTWETGLLEPVSKETYLRFQLTAVK